VYAYKHIHTHTQTHTHTHMTSIRKIYLFGIQVCVCVQINTQTHMTSIRKFHLFGIHVCVCIQTHTHTNIQEQKQLKTLQHQKEEFRLNHPPPQAHREVRRAQQIWGRHAPLQHDLHPQQAYQARSEELHGRDCRIPAYLEQLQLRLQQP
jgi:hypothetical protein